MEKFLTQLLNEKNIERDKIVNKTIERLLNNAKITELTKSIVTIKDQILKIFDMNKEKEEFKEINLNIDNSNANKPYEFIFDMKDFPNIIIKEIRNLEVTGLEFDHENNRIFGIPTISNSLKLQIVFYSKEDPNKDLDIKEITFIINADPKDLWKNIPSRQGDLYSKPDEDAFKGTFLDKKIVIASKRGRSHAHEGSFRDDNFSTKSLPNDWAIIAIADGAGSAKYARQGSKIATEFIVNRFNEQEVLMNFDRLIQEYYSQTDNKQETSDSEGIINNQESLINSESIENKLNDDSIEQTEITPESEEKNDDTKLNLKRSIIKILYSGVTDLYSELLKFASENQLEINTLNTTLAFTLCKKFEFGYVVLSFGVGDSPINIMNKDSTSVRLLNIMDVGEQSGGTRFITMRSVFENPNMGSRFGINKYDDFSKLFLMTDGIYDPKFITENKLEDIQTWKDFLDDLDGENEDKCKIDFLEDENIDTQLLSWMDFWSKGNHDDRTLAIIY